VVKHLVLLVCIASAACSFNAKGFDNRTCAADSDCPRPDQSCQDNACVLRACSVASDCGADFVFDCKDGACVANGCTSDSDCGLGYTCEQRYCQASFNVATADSGGNTTMTVTFDAPPDPTSATNVANYTVSGLTLSGTPTLAGETVTITTSPQMATSYSVTVKNVTRAADGVKLRGETAAFNGRSTFDVTSAVSASSRAVLVAFNATPDYASAMSVANYALSNGLTLAGAPLVVGNTVTLTTSAQAPIGYTVTVTGVFRATDNEPLTTTTATFMGRGDFSVISATPVDSNTVKVSFSHPPDMATAVTLGNYAIPGLTLSGVPVLSGNDVFLVTSNQQAKLYTVTVSNVTRASDGEALVTSSADFVGVTPFDVTAASAVTTSKVSVTFDAVPNAAQATMPSSYTIPGLTVSAATLSGSTVTLTTSLQTNTTYNLTVNGVTRAGDAEPLLVNTASLTGRTPFDVSAVTGMTAHTVTVTFDAPPDPVQSQSISSYVISGLTIQQASLTGPATVTLTTSVQMAQSYTLTVNGVTRMADGEPLTTNSGMFTGRTAFDVSSAMAQTSSSFNVTFDAPPEMNSAGNPANYSVTNLTVLGASYPGSGNVVTLTTSPMLAQTYTVTVTNVVRASDLEPLSGQVASFVGRVPFNVTQAKSTHTTTIQVTFDAAPNMAQAVDITNYSVPGLALTGTPVLVGQTVTLTTSTQSATTYTVTVGGVTRMSDGEPLTMASASFIGRAPFDVSGANAVDNHTVQVAFDAAPDLVSATTAANYTITPGVSVSAATLAGNTVTLTTSAQSATTFTVTVKNVTRASDGETLTGNNTTFNGRAPFDVASAQATSNKQFTLSFDAPPNGGQATNAANYSITGGLTISAVTYPGTGNTVTVTTTSQNATSYTVTVSNVTRASDGEPLTLTSTSFNGRASFNVASATSVGNTKMTVTFDAAPESTSATNPANYAITAGSLSLSGTPTLSGNVVTLTTSTQTAGATYQITVANVIRASDSEPLTKNFATFSGKAGFNVVDASSVNQTTMTVTYDAVPNTGQAVTLGNYSVRDSHNNPLNLSGVPVLSGSTVTITTQAQTDETYTVIVQNVTRASDSAPMTVNVAQFVHQTFNVVSAVALTSHSISVTYSDPPGTGATTLGNYTIKCGGSCTLAVSGTPTLSGNTVTLTTAAQTGGTSYTVTVANVIRASDSDPLNNKTATFTGIATFNVSGAASVTSASVSVTFDAPPNPAAAQTIGNYVVTGGSLTLTGAPVLVGNTVTINTSPQAAVTYTVTVNNVTRAADAEPLTVNSKTFAGTAQTKPTISSVVVNTTTPNNSTTFYNTGTAAVTINGSQFTGVNCPAGVVLNDTDGNGNALNTPPTSCTVVSDTVITATFPAGIKSNYAGWDVLVTNAVGQSTAGATDKLVIKAGLLVASVYVRTDGATNYNHEYFEIFNPTANTIDVTNVTGAATAVPLSIHTFDGTNDSTFGYSKINPAPGSYPLIPSHKFMLISSTASSADTWYSHADASWNIATVTSPRLYGIGTLYLSLSGTAQSKVLDKVGWGGANSAARCEGTCATGEQDARSNQRLPGSGGGAYTDTDGNAGDFKGWSFTLNPLGTKDAAQ
jgi:hypothetical protein